MEIRFDIINKDAYTYEAQYNMAEKSFDIPTVSADIYIAVAYLNLGIDSEDMTAKSLWGFSPMSSWKNMNLKLPAYMEGGIKLLGVNEGGIILRADKEKMWEAFYDKTMGWYCIGNPLTEKDDKALKIIKNMIVVLDVSRALKAIWIQPKFV